MLHVPSNSFSDDRVAVRSSVGSADPRVAEVDSIRLLQGQRELLIRHGGECYRLRHTRNDKLILTK
jgi:hemin uptake protein HemP